MGNAETRLSRNAIDKVRVERNFRRIGGILGKKQGGTGSDDPDAVYVPHSLATAANDFVVASGVGVFIKKTLAQVKSILGLGSTAYLNTTTSVGTPGVDTLIPTEKAVRDAIPTGTVGAHALLDGSVHTDSLAGTCTAGDVVYANATPKWARLPKSTDGLFLKLVSCLPAWSAVGAGSGAAFKVGTYTGDGLDDRNITGVGFDPTFVIVMRLDGAVSIRFKTAAMGVDTKKAEGALNPNEIQAFITDGFQVGTDASVNNSGSEYSYVAFG